MNHLAGTECYLRRMEEHKWIKVYSCNTYECPGKDILREVALCKVVPGVLAEPVAMCDECGMTMLTVETKKVDLDPQPPFIDGEGSRVAAPGSQHSDVSSTRSSSAPVHAWNSDIAMDPHPFEGGSFPSVCQRRFSSADGSRTVRCQWGRRAPIHNTPRSSSRVLDFTYTEHPLPPGHHAFEGDLLGRCQFIVEAKPRGPLEMERFFCHRPPSDLVHIAALAHWQSEQPLLLPEGWTAERLDRGARYSDPAAYAAHADLDAADRAAQLRYHRMLNYARAHTNLSELQVMEALEAAHAFYAGEQEALS